MKLRTATLAAVLLTASIPNLPTTAQARPFGFHGGFGGGWGHGGWGHGGWGWGGAEVGLAAGALVGAALAAPYYGGYGYAPIYGDDYGYAPVYSDDYGYAPVYSDDYGYAPVYSDNYSYAPASYAYAPGTAMATRPHTRVTDAMGMAATACTELATARKGLGTVGTGPDTHERHMLDRCIEPMFATVSLSLRARLLR